MGVNVKGFMLQPVGPEALGWFKEPIESMDDFREVPLPHPARHGPGQTYKDIGGPAVAMGGGDILPALEKGVRSTPPSGAARSRTASSASRKCSSTTTSRACTRSWSTPISTSTVTSGQLPDPDHQQRAMEVAAECVPDPVRSPTASTRTAWRSRTSPRTTACSSTTLPPITSVEYMNAGTRHAREERGGERLLQAGVGVACGTLPMIAVPFWAGAQTSNAESRPWPTRSRCSRSVAALSSYSMMSSQREHRLATGRRPARHRVRRGRLVDGPEHG